MLTYTNNATKNTLQRIKFAQFDVYKAWQFTKYIVRKYFIFEAATLMGTHWINIFEPCPFRSIFTVLESFNGHLQHG